MVHPEGMLLPPFNFEGVGDEVIISALLVSFILLVAGFLFIRKKIRVRMVHPEESDNVNSVREAMAAPRLRRHRACTTWIRSNVPFASPTSSLVSKPTAAISFAVSAG